MNIAVIFAHPDDGALNAAGTLARWIAEGHEITAICCTSGNMGTLRRDQSSDEIGAIRIKELIAANEIIGIQQTEVLDFPDGCLMDPEKLRQELVRCIRQYRPDRVLTHDPWAAYEVHRDHIVVGQMASEAASFSCFPLLHPEHLESGLEPHNAGEVWYMGLLGRAPNTFVSIKDQLDSKVRALLQFEVTMASLDQLFAEQEISNDDQRAHQWMESYARRLGEPVGLDAAEAFLVQRCLPGHFDNVPELTREMLGQPALEPTIIR